MLQKVAGSKIYIGSAVTYKDTITLADFNGQAWTEIDGWLTTGDLGADQETITQVLINSGITRYAKGTISFPAMTNTFTPMKTDAGQVAYKAATRVCQPFAFKIEWGADCAIEGIVTISNGTPGVVTWNGHGLANGDVVSFTTTGTLPTGLTPSTDYYVVSASTNTFSVAATPGGTAINTSAAGSGVHTASAIPGGETDLFYGFALPGAKTGGDASATRTLTFNIQPIARSVEV